MAESRVFDNVSSIDDRKVRDFILSPSFIAEFEGKQPEWGFNGLGYFVYKRTYSRPLPTGGTEEWWQTVRRVVEGTYTIQKIHCKNNALRWDDRKAQASAQEMYRRIWDFRFTPPGRGLWAMGTDVVYRTGGSALNNCGFVSTEDIDVDFAAPFTFLMDMSMLGVGVGGDTKGSNKVLVGAPVLKEGTFTVEDSREGWIHLVRTILLAVSGKTQLPGRVDFSAVRKKNEPIKGFGGVSSGPGPLAQLAIDLLNLYDADKTLSTWLDGDEDSAVFRLNIVANKSGTLRSITSTLIVDTFNYIGKCVVSGNVRRSAEIMLGDPFDQEFLDLKRDPEALMSRRWCSNNSIVAPVGTNYAHVVPSIAENGEPGIVWLENAQNFSRMGYPADYKDKKAQGTNPCSEQTLHSYELCCLAETFPARHDSIEDYKKTLKFAYLYAKTVTLVPTHFPRTNEVLLRNRRIGLSMSGIQQARHKFGHAVFRDSFCKSGYDYVEKLDELYSDWLCVRPSIKRTSVKPSGSVSLLAGATPGIHYAESEFYIRRVRVGAESEYVRAAQIAGLHVEPCSSTPNTMIVSFPVQEENFFKSKKEATIWEQFELAAEMQHSWADNQVSATITFNRHEIKDIATCLSLYETRLKSISLLPVSEHGYAQAPYEEITEEQYQQMMSNMNMPLTEAMALVENRHEMDDKFCDGDSCTI